MYLVGHELILHEAMKIFKEKMSKRQRKQLKDGVKYPDIPCGQTKMKFKNGKIDKTKYNPKLCKQYKVFKVFSETYYGTDQLYQSHRGKFAINHAQTPDPKYTMERVQYKIIRKCLLWYQLAIDTGDLTWLGMMLHTVQDSYSLGHVQRYTNDQIVKKRFTKGTAVKRYKFWDNLTLLTAAKVFTLVKSGVYYKTNFKSEKELLDFTIEKLKEDKEIQELLKKHDGFLMRTVFGDYFDDNNKKILDLIKDTLFYDINFKKLDKKFNVENNIKKHKWTKHNDKDFTYITNFYWLQNQKGLFHQKHNTIDVLKKSGNYERAVRNTKDLIEMFVKKAPLKKVFEYLVNEVINVHKTLLKEQSGRIIKSQS